MREVIGSVYDYRCGKDLNMFGQVIGFLYCPDTDKEEKTEFELSGLIAEELEVMGRKERRVVMRRAGLNPDLYDF
ncbi:hypothetical protein GN277_26295 [Lachnospiraceae bacterium WCA-9-b2]|uniref:Uncharacterized protein n=1 Tax=Sporofaciens musculi TaxID=2681861 RepID=A0A7X3MM25_9FIRM|nr:hypothetical protein [Sporofaciens musculi]MCI9423608.1 hypothetical protein [Dorea sp.]MXP78722.1 hypothetical protein [Sporofaciens musculi]